MTDFIKISYTGRVKNGPVFDTTSKEVAEKEGVFDEKKIYALFPVVVGGGQVIPGLDEKLKGMKSGDKKKVEIPPEKGYGNKDPKLIRLVPRSVFKKERITPIPGMPIELDGRPARIQTVAGGRVRVDFNHELAGKTLTFEVKVEEKAATDADKARFLVERSFNDSKDFDIKLKAGMLEIRIPEKAYKDRNILVRKASLAAEIFKYLGNNKITFTEEWSKVENKPEGGGGKDDQHDAKGDS